MTEQSSITIPVDVLSEGSIKLARELTIDDIMVVLIRKTGTKYLNIKPFEYKIIEIGMYTITLIHEDSSEESIKVWVIPKQSPRCPVCKRPNVKRVILNWEEKIFEEYQEVSIKTRVVDEFYSCLDCGIRFDKVKD